jgi:hypothetical protein
MYHLGLVGIGVLVAVVIIISEPFSEEIASQQEVSVVLDVSRSMQVEDIMYRDQTISRLQTAKTLIQRAVDRIGDAEW